MSGRRGQQTCGYRCRDQQSFEAHHGYYPSSRSIEKTSISLSR
jgi:hypothetical protein